MNELKPCPFCGGKVDPDGWLDGSGKRGPECEGCGSTASDMRTWNTRHADPAAVVSSAVSSDQPKEGSGAAQPAREWYCQHCDKVLDPEEVTYSEYHDERTGGCGYYVTSREVLPQSAGSLQIEGGPEPKAGGESQPTSALTAHRLPTGWWCVSRNDDKHEPIATFLFRHDALDFASGEQATETGNVPSRASVAIPQSGQSDDVPRAGRMSDEEILLNLVVSLLGDGVSKLTAIGNDAVSQYARRIKLARAAALPTNTQKPTSALNPEMSLQIYFVKREQLWCQPPRDAEPGQLVPVYAAKDFKP